MPQTPNQKNEVLHIFSFLPETTSSNHHKYYAHIKIGQNSVSMPLNLYQIRAFLPTLTNLSSHHLFDEERTSHLLNGSRDIHNGLVYTKF